MAYENKPGQGVMFPRDKQGNPNRPDYSGTINVAGHDYDISAWEKVARSGGRYISVEVREPYQAQRPQGGYQQPQQAPQAPQQRQYQPRPQAPAPQQPAPQYRQGSMPVNAPAEGSDLPFSQSPGYEDKLPNPFLD